MALCSGLATALLLRRSAVVVQARRRRRPAMILVSLSGSENDGTEQPVGLKRPRHLSNGQVDWPIRAETWLR